MTHTHRDGTDIWPENAQFYNGYKSTDPRARLKIVSIRKVHMTHTRTHTHTHTHTVEPTYGHKPNNFMTIL